MVDLKELLERPDVQEFMKYVHIFEFERLSEYGVAIIYAEDPIEATKKLFKTKEITTYKYVGTLEGSKYQHLYMYWQVFFCDG